MADEAGPNATETRLQRELRLVIRRARERLKMSQEEFARALGVHLGRQITQSQVSDWERGRYEPSSSVLLAVGELVGLSVDELRAAGPRALVDRVDRLEDELERLVGGRGDRDDLGKPASGTLDERVAALEREWERIGDLLAQVIEVLDSAHLWPGGRSADNPTPESRRRSPPALGKR